MSRLAENDDAFRRRLHQRRREVMGVGDDLLECPPPPFRKGFWHSCELPRGHAGYHQWADPKSTNPKRAFWDGHGKAVQRSEVRCGYCGGQRVEDSMIYARRMSMRYEDDRNNYTLACCDACFDQIEDTNREEMAEYELQVL